ncbi:MAG: hypothetical protein IJE22_02610 [Oscillibacter sp.]|nr:hypothetical protein [Oscillibacter sp.]
MAMNTDQRQNWAGEVTPGDWNRPVDPPMNQQMNSTMNPRMNPSMSMTPQWSGQNGSLQMQNNLPTEVIESPTTTNEAYLGSLKAMLLRNRGNYIVATFLIGTQNTVSWEGILYEVGNDYVTIYQPGRDRYIVSDMYSIKYMEFYDTQRRRMCDELLARQGMGGNDHLASTPRGW